MELLKVTNLIDLQKAQQGLIPPNQVRSETVSALVDTGATTLVLPEELCRRLGLPFSGHRPVRHANGQVARIPWVSGVWIELLGRNMSGDALVEAPGTTPLIGQIPLEALDLIVDPRSRSLSVNPASPDEPLLDLLHVA